MKCACGWPAEDLATRTCGHWQCEGYALGWGALELRAEHGGWRHYLHNLPVHCGAGLLLALGPASDFGPLYPSREGMSYARVRYESPLATSEGREPPALFYAPLGHYDAVITGGSHMRLRWPYRAR